MSRKTLALRHMKEKNQKRIKTLVEQEREKIQKKEVMDMIYTCKMISLMVLRNQGWADVRLTRFDKAFGEIVKDINKGHLTVEDIADTIYDETRCRLVNLELKRDDENL